MWGNIAIEVLLAFIITFSLTPYTIKIAKKIGAMDIPTDSRRMHKKAMPKFGGPAVVLGFLISVIYMLIVTTIENKVQLFDKTQNWTQLLGILIGIAIISIFCFFDDKKGIKATTKLLGQVLAAIVVVSSGLRIDFINIPFLEQNILLGNAVSIFITIIWIVGITNAINLIDGLDGLSSGIAIISSVSLLLIFILNGSPFVAIILITALAGSLLGFLPYNFNPAKTFIGDIGTNFIGFIISVVSILGIAKTATALVVVLPIIVLGLPIFDTLFAIIRRLIKNKSFKAVFEADRGHLHHKLVEKGFTTKEAVWILYGISFSSGVFAIILLEDGIWKATSFAFMVVAALAIGWREIMNNKKEE